MRILIVTPRDPRRQGGVERHVAEVARRHAAAGHEVTVLCGDAEGGAPRAEAYDGYEIRALPAHPRGRDWFLVPALWGEMGRAAPEIVHVQSYHTLVPPLAMLRALSLRVPYLLTFHGGGHSSGLRNGARRAQRLLLRPLLARAARLVAVARFEIEEYGRELRLGPERFALIPNGTDLTFAAGEPDRSGPPTIASVGRLERYKGHQRVIKAFPTVLERRPEARLQIVGVGPYEGELRRLVERLGLGDRVELTSVPADRPEEMAALLRRVSVFALLSEFETHPIAAVEAAAAGCRLVVAAGGGTGELAAAGFARAVALDAPPAAVGAVLAEELAGPPLTDRPPTISWDECAALLLDLYREVLADVDRKRSD
ncbi:MAG: glycosyltransferase family 4 protein [Actinobacteria bacterium]|nr:glycosyltransferase family 4 protein [Actinomycetota bacterium]